MHENDRFRSVDSETASLINTITGSRLKFDTREEKIDMCKAIDDMRKESKEEGRTEGHELTHLKDIRALMRRLKYTAQQAMDLLEIPTTDWPKYLAKL